LGRRTISRSTSATRRSRTPTLKRSRE
jgi:hypothetical protein